MNLSRSATSQKPRVLVAMSGGVDSSVAALLLKQQGYPIEGLFMKNWEEDDTETYCSAAQDIEDAQAVCDALEIPLHRVNFAAEYWDNVFTQFLEEYQAGRTPNPDIWCNREIKFKALLEYALGLGADMIATGHYARIQESNNTFSLATGLDQTKDQSYFLYTLGQPQLARTLFPIGNLKKTEVRILAENAGFINAKKKDSTGICFIGEKRFKAFLSRFLPSKPGDIKTLEGSTIGHHDGLMFYTIGQREGLGIGGIKGTNEAPWYVVHKNLTDNTLIVAQGHDHPALFSSMLTCNALHWVSGFPPETPLACTAKVRYRQYAQTCQVTKLDTEHYQVNFQVPERAVTPGQSIVFYLGDRCLGGGIIENAL